eukprot:TRINITY_DN32400_c2_g1_i1.p1 TRINITY_DN32400_c2_g1~~TRINITY_DN32400_c2_g1_i1.p1  ORF type:complete len:318 (-),score=20.10 TRINITY_DN32400_c2_g1_i1:60-1013(-)
MVDVGEPACKASRMALPDKPPQSWLDAFQAVVTPGVDNAMLPVFKRIDGMEATLSKTVQNVEELNQRMLKFERSGPSSSASTISVSSSASVSSRIEIRGWCTYEDRLTAGYTRAQACTLLSKLCSCLPEELKDSVDTQPILFANRNSNMLVNIKNPNILHEVMGIFRENMPQDDPERTIFVRQELPKWRKDANSLIARLSKYCGKVVATRGVTSIQWFPDYAITMVCNTSKQGHVLVRLDEDNRTKIIWEDKMLELTTLPTKLDIGMAFRNTKRCNGDLHRHHEGAHRLMERREAFILYDERVGSRLPFYVVISMSL